MGENRWTVRGRVSDVVDGRASGRVESRKVTHPFGDFVIGARRIAADADAADDLARDIQGHAPAEEDEAARDMFLAARLAGGRREVLGVEEIRLSKASQRMPGLCEGVEPRR